MHESLNKLDLQIYSFEFFFNVICLFSWETNVANLGLLKMESVTEAAVNLVLEQNHTGLGVNADFVSLVPT